MELNSVLRGTEPEYGGSGNRKKFSVKCRDRKVVSREQIDYGEPGKP